MIAFERGQDEAASDRWKNVLVLRSNYPEANFMLGELLQKHQQYERAREFYERALDQDSSKPVYYARVGGVFMLLRNFLKALEVFQHAAQRFPTEANMHYFVALAARATANFDLARVALRRGRTDPPTPD